MTISFGRFPQQRCEVPSVARDKDSLLFRCQCQDLGIVEGPEDGIGSEAQDVVALATKDAANPLG